MMDGAFAATARTDHEPAGDRRIETFGARTGVELRVEPVAGTDLVRDYIRGAESLAPFYAGHPLDPAAYRRKAEAVRERLPARARAAVADALIPTTPAAAARLERILAGDGFFVTTGQQTALFGGPLYTLYKLLTATRLAAAVENLLGRPCLAVFWMASDDHDWAEANHTSVISHEGELVRIALDAPPDAPPVAMSEHRLGDDVEAALTALEGALPASAFAGPILELARSAYRPGETMGSAFAALLRGLMRETDVALLDPAAPALKRAARPVLHRELERAAPHSRMLASQANRLETAGYPVQVTIADEASNVFLHDALGRDRLVRDGDAWMLRRTRRSLATGELTALLDQDPARFSPNVLLRPVVESALLPTLAYIGGPAELAYFAQIGCLFRAHGIEPPIVFPRFAVTIIEPHVRRLLEKFGLTPEEVRCPFDELVTRIMRDELPPAVSAPLARLRSAITDEYDQLTDTAAGIDPTLRGWVQRNRNEALVRVHATEKKILSHVRRRSAVETAQLRRIAAHLFPDGVPQERALNILPLLGRFGDGLLHDISDAMTVTLDRSAPVWQGADCSWFDVGPALPARERRE
ncbi:MAG: bacillithiol biosynthesis cysteine-adding enzyme BshC [Gemmatimonadetes bacterium]|nr:bacillithiol biosynthesis cysteine-adding enzyme BshC [Gemmatimonadota bacterium]